MKQQTTRPATLTIIGDTLQFVMELASLTGIGLIGWHIGNKTIWGALLAIVMILGLGTVWGRFRAPGFVPTGREPDNPISGPARIALELSVYALGIFGIWWSGREQMALGIVGIMVLTLIVSHQRLIGLWFTRV